MRCIGLLGVLLLIHISFEKRLLKLKSKATGKKINACKGKYVLNCRFAKVYLSAFKHKVITLPGGVKVAKKNNIRQRTRGVKSVAYAGHGCEAIFTIKGRKVMGNVEYKDGKDFVLEPCKGSKGCHVWKQEDTARMRKNSSKKDTIRELSLTSEESEPYFTVGTAEKYKQKGINDNTTKATISVKFYYTIEFAKATDDIQQYFYDLVAKTNLGYKNSGIPVEVKIFCIEKANLHDNDNSKKMFDIFKKYKKSVKELRGTADAAALLVMDTDACGRGSFDSWRTGNTVTIQEKECALTSFTFGHEIGHNFGANHDWEHADTTYWNLEPGFGSYIKKPFYTILAYSKPGYWKRVNYYSGPNVRYKGTITGSTENDNARVIKENRFGFEAVGDESGSCRS